MNLQKEPLEMTQKPKLLLTSTKLVNFLYIYMEIESSNPDLEKQSGRQKKLEPPTPAPPPSQEMIMRFSCIHIRQLRITGAAIIPG